MAVVRWARGLEWKVLRFKRWTDGCLYRLPQSTADSSQETSRKRCRSFNGRLRLSVKSLVWWTNKSRWILVVLLSHPQRDTFSCPIFVLRIQKMQTMSSKGLTWNSAVEVVAVVGSSGSGKTTLTRLLIDLTLDIEVASSWTVWELSTCAVPSLRKQVVAVRQDLQIFSRSLAFNVMLENPDISLEQAAASLG